MKVLSDDGKMYEIKEWAGETNTTITINIGHFMKLMSRIEAKEKEIRKLDKIIEENHQSMQYQREQVVEWKEKYYELLGKDKGE